MIAALMSWSWFPTPAFMARIAALCALIHSLVAIGILAQQLIALTRAHIHPWILSAPRSCSISSLGRSSPQIPIPMRFQVQATVPIRAQTTTQALVRVRMQGQARFQDRQPSQSMPILAQEVAGVTFHGKYQQ